MLITYQGEQPKNVSTTIPSHTGLQSSQTVCIVKAI